LHRGAGCGYSGHDVTTLFASVAWDEVDRRLARADKAIAALHV
jgi:hypothetical protein